MTELQSPPGAAAAAELCETKFRVNGMDCASCVAHVEKAIRRVPGVQKVAVNLALGRASVSYDPAAAAASDIAVAATDAGYPAVAVDALTPHTPAEHDHAANAREWLVRGVAGIVLWLPLEILHLFAHGQAQGMAAAAMRPTWLDWLNLTTSTVAIVFIGGAFYRSAWRAARRLTTNMDTLIALGASVAYGYSLVALAGTAAGTWPKPMLYFNEATALFGLISFGHWLEARARTKAGSAIRGLMDLTPVTALRVPAPIPAADEPPSASQGSFRSLGILNQPSAPTGAAQASPVEVPVAELRVGDYVLVRPGDRIPIDGVVAAGRSTVDESMLTGEPIPAERSAGDLATGGTINQDGALTLRVTRIGADTALAQIVSLVEAAQNSKPPVQKLADQIAAIFVPTVLAIALATGLGWAIYGTVVGTGQAVMWARIAQSVCGVLIVACPCALGLAVPAALMVGTGRGAKLGILFRDIGALQAAEKVQNVLLDKTGTITAGRPSVRRVLADDGDENELLRLAASVEHFSTHPLAKAIVAEAAGRGITLAQVDQFKNEPGVGVSATVGGRNVFVGVTSTAAAARASAPGGNAQRGRTDSTPSAESSATLVSVRLDDREIGVIELVDQVKTYSRRAVAGFHAAGLKTLLLSGDRESAVRAVADEVGIGDIRFGVRPDGKAEVVRTMQGNRRRVAMIGDGINDAPALAQADLGIAIGGGSDIAKEAGGIVLVRGSLMDAVAALALSRATMRVIRQNLFFAFFYNALMIPLAAFGVLPPWMCAAAMAMSDVTVLGNALRLRTKRL